METDSSIAHQAFSLVLTLIGSLIYLPEDVRKLLMMIVGYSYVLSCVVFGCIAAFAYFTSERYRGRRFQTALATPVIRIPLPVGALQGVRLRSRDEDAPEWYHELRHSWSDQGGEPMRCCACRLNGGFPALLRDVQFLFVVDDKRPQGLSKTDVVVDIWRCVTCDKRSVGIYVDHNEPRGRGQRLAKSEKYNRYWRGGDRFVDEKTAVEIKQSEPAEAWTNSKATAVHLDCPECRCTRQHELHFCQARRLLPQPRSGWLEVPYVKVEVLSLQECKQCHVLSLHSFEHSYVDPLLGFGISRGFVFPKE
jgi:hypothetical protein